MASRELRLVVSGDADALQRSLARAGASVSRFSAQTEKANKRSASSWRSTALGIDRDSKKAAASFKGMIGAAGGAAVAIGGAYKAYGFAKGAISATTQLARSTASLQAITRQDTVTTSKWVSMAKARGIQGTQLNRMFITLGRNVRSADQGSAKAVTTFRRLGISQDQLKRTNPTALVLKIADAFKNRHIPALERAAIAQQLFGRQGQALLPLLAQGSAGIQKQLDAVTKYGAYLSGGGKKSALEFVQAQREQKLMWEGLRISLGEQLIPLLTPAMKKFSAFAVEMKTGSGAGGDFADAMRAVGRAIGGTFEFFVKLNDFTHKLNDNFLQTIDTVEGLTDRLNDNLRGSLGMSVDGSPSARAPSNRPGYNRGTRSTSPRFRGGGVVPTMVSPGEMLGFPDGRAAIVPGPRVAADNVLATVPAGTAVFTGHGQAMLAAGASPAQALRGQLPHFRAGGPVVGATGARASGRSQFDLRSLVALAKSVGMGQPALAAAIAMGESGGNARAHNLSGIEDSRGLWQINSRAHPSYDRNRLFDPVYNAQAALRISSGGRQWRPWTVFTRGIYRRWFGQARALSASTPAGVAGTPGSSYQQTVHPALAALADPRRQRGALMDIGYQAFQAGAEGQPLFVRAGNRPTDLLSTLAETARMQNTTRTVTVPGTPAGVAGGVPGRGILRPVTGPLTGRFGENRPGHAHAGLDIAARAGARVRAMLAGTVIGTGWQGGYGNTVDMAHPGGWGSKYAHLSKIMVSKGARLARGAVVGLVGSTGNSTGPHLHWEVTKGGQRVNPANFYRRGGIAGFRTGGTPSLGGLDWGRAVPSAPWTGSVRGSYLGMGASGASGAMGALGRFMGTPTSRIGAGIQALGQVLQNAALVSDAVLHRLAAHIQLQLRNIAKGGITAAERPRANMFGAALGAVTGAVQGRFGQVMHRTDTALARAEMERHLAQNRLIMSGAQEGTPAWQAKQMEMARAQVALLKGLLATEQAALQAALTDKVADTPEQVAAMRESINELIISLSDAEVALYQSSQATTESTEQSEEDAAEEAEEQALREAEIAAQEALTEELKALRKELRERNKFAKKASQVGTDTAKRMLADVLSGEIVGFGAQPRAMSAGGGVGVRF